MRNGAYSYLTIIAYTGFSSQWRNCEYFEIWIFTEYNPNIIFGMLKSEGCTLKKHILQKLFYYFTFLSSGVKLSV